LSLTWFLRLFKISETSRKLRFSKLRQPQNKTSSPIWRKKEIQEINFGTVKKLLFLWVLQENLPFFVFDTFINWIEAQLTRMLSRIKKNYKKVHCKYPCSIKEEIRTHSRQYFLSFFIKIYFNYTSISSLENNFNSSSKTSVKTKINFPAKNHEKRKALLTFIKLF
jgi:hypothetical protein